VATLLSSVNLWGIETPVSTEYFATSADAHLVLGHIAPEGYTCDTPDRKEKTLEASLRRLARAFWDRQRGIVCGAVRRVKEESGASSVIVAGMGAALFARECGGTDLTK